VAVYVYGTEGIIMTMYRRVGKQLIIIPLMGILTMTHAGINAFAAINANDIGELNAAAEPEASAGEVVEKLINAWFDKRNIMPGVRSETGKIYYSATSGVSGTPESKSWPRARQIAFKKALNAARSKFIFDKFGYIRTSTDRSTFEDSGTGAPSTDSNVCGMGQYEAYWEKVKALAGAKLDQALEASGVDPERYKSSSEEKQKELFLDSAITKTIETASGEISGLIPVQSFEGQSKNGTTVIGVIMMYSPKLYVLADDLRHGREPTLSGKKAGKSLLEYTDRPEEQLKNMMGLRIVFDEDSNPVLLSYGQWGYSYTGNNAQSMERHRITAFKNADVRALEDLSEFINGKLRMRNETEAGEIVREYIAMNCDDGNLHQRDESEEQLVDRLSGELEIKSSANVAGTTEVKRWSYRNEFGQEVIGVVRAWTLDGLNSAMQVKEQENDLSVALKQGNKMYGTKSIVGEELSNPEEDF
jgi:hypothetical protein